MWYIYVIYVIYIYVIYIYMCDICNIYICVIYVIYIYIYVIYVIYIYVIYIYNTYIYVIYVIYIYIIILFNYMTSPLEVSAWTFLVFAHEIYTIWPQRRPKIPGPQEARSSPPAQLYLTGSAGKSNVSINQIW